MLHFRKRQNTHGNFQHASFKIYTGDIKVLGTVPHSGSDTIFVQIYMDPPPGVPGVSKGAPGSTKDAI